MGITVDIVDNFVYNLLPIEKDVDKNILTNEIIQLVSMKNVCSLPNGAGDKKDETIDRYIQLS